MATVAVRALLACLGRRPNDDMLSPAQADGLTVEVGDCLSHIASQPDNSVTLITGFHIVEHLPPEVLHDFVKHAHRVVRPGGLVIFETPNPENILVGSNRFYSDPTHIHPLPPKYLEFVVEFYGFSEAICIGVNQPNLRYQSGAAAAFLEIMELFPDYAVLGRKPKEGGLRPVFWSLCATHIHTVIHIVIGRSTNLLIKPIRMRWDWLI